MGLQLKQVVHAQNPQTCLASPPPPPPTSHVVRSMLLSSFPLAPPPITGTVATFGSHTVSWCPTGLVPLPRDEDEGVYPLSVCIRAANVARCPEKQRKGGRGGGGQRAAVRSQCGKKNPMNGIKSLTFCSLADVWSACVFSSWPRGTFCWWGGHALLICGQHVSAHECLRLDLKLSR